MNDASQANVLDLLPNLRPRLRALFSQHGIRPEEAEDILLEAILLFLKRSPRAGDPATLLLGLVEDRIRHRQKRLHRDRCLLHQVH